LVAIELDLELDEREKIIALTIDHTVNKINSNELVFCYNAAFKGLFVDGGVTNNIPYDAFRIWDNDQINKTIALKLDNNFPEQFIVALTPIVEKKRKALETFYQSDRNGLDDLDELNKIYRIFKEDVIVLLKKISGDEKEILLDDKNLSQLMTAAIKIIDERKKNFTPWNKQVSSIGGVLNAFMYGSDQGQVRQLSDNNHIIPLYCYGITTYDFNLDQLQALVDFSNTQSKKDVMTYFA
jgi:hypothetical protein